MKLAQDQRRHVRGLARRKEGHVPCPTSPYADELPDGNCPSARIRRLRARNPRFVSNREGWRRFLAWQDWLNRHLQLKDTLSFWEDARRARARREAVGSEAV